MSPSSFKKDVGTPPSRYRTPSPPRFAFEPLSPANPNIKLATTVVQNTTDGYPSEIKKLTQCQAHTDRAWHKQERDARNTMDTFASIALATHQLPYTSYAAPSSGIPHSELPLTVETQYTERPPKRARSEKVQSLEWTRSEAKTGTRPVTSYAQTTDTRTLDAELLLNFSHAARFAYPYGFSGQTSFNQPKQVSPTAFPIPVDLISPALCNFVPKQALQTSLATGTHVSPSLAAKEGALSCGEDTQDFSTSNECNDLSGSKSELVAQGKNYETNGSKFPLSGYKKPETLHLDTFEVGHEGISHKIDDENTLGYDVATLPTSLSNEILMNGRLDRPAMETNVNTGLVATSRHQQQSTHKLDGIVAGDLASTSPIDVTDEAASTNEPDLHASYDHKPNESYTLTSTDDNIQSTLRQTSTPAICTTCQFTRNSLNIDNDNGPTSWISCDACKSWFHFACAGFKNEREVRSVDKYRCRECKPLYGPTTYVRKSSRAHSAIDYAGLNQGVLKTSDERTEHHYIKPIKDGKIVFLPETFARMRPELVTAEYFEKGNGMREPIIIPAHFNPRHKNTAMQHPGQTQQDGTSKTGLMQEISLLEEWLSDGVECQSVPDYGQDALDMVMPRDLTVRMVADLYGPEEKVEVIDVKSQNGENKKWNMKRWADYYESSGNKTVRNVISLEVSQSKLGRLIRRPQIVRELDLQDSVWPLELQAKGEYPRVQLYCLMSVADCFTDFHIDFGGSSVFYHILKGKKTFLFIPPKEKHLKKYEEWCLSPAQNWTFLADQTKECYRVDLVEGDTMLIPAGWIHAVWTPEDSLVIGGNFLTRMHYGMQLRVAQAEKVTGVARKFRYPHYQKIHWYTALQYLQDDPLPQTVKDMLQEGGVFHRDKPAHHAFDEWGENSEPGLENYHARYYAQTELEGLPDLVRYLLRTALIDLGNITDGITAETRNAVKRAIPRGYGEPLDIIKEFAAWCAWKRGNEQLPHWAYPHAVPEGGVSDKLNATTLKKLDQEAAIQAPRRQSARKRSQLVPSKSEDVPSPSKGLHGSLKDSHKQVPNFSSLANPGISMALSSTPSKESSLGFQKAPEVSLLSDSKSSTKRPRSSTNYRKPACDSCRKRRRACKHRDQILPFTLNVRGRESVGDPTQGTSTMPNTEPKAFDVDATPFSGRDEDSFMTIPGGEGGSKEKLESKKLRSPNLEALLKPSYLVHHEPNSENAPSEQRTDDLRRAQCDTMQNMSFKRYDSTSSIIIPNRGRTKACNDCRKSKVGNFRSSAYPSADFDLASVCS